METNLREQLLSEMRSEARAHNKFLTIEYLKSLNPRMLASLTQPSSRMDYLERLHMIEKMEGTAEKEKRSIEKRFNGELVIRPSEKMETGRKPTIPIEASSNNDDN
jgi:hypothetical protein